ncbi:hypothetical protein SCLCIDRAFT_384905 [Scleroderma citrinum Foug A]|uniref:Uncharacterized protein n=1 Tax=Scleroderma citrinum Foug A TaxID=1036808 RepID=A0A0C3DDB4_9AGAM|nr:hypothetical protein SCLCIDRAFT_384905 [Scleroderma citrinum Foug A]
MSPCYHGRVRIVYYFCDHPHSTDSEHCACQGDACRVHSKDPEIQLPRGHRRRPHNATLTVLAGSSAALCRIRSPLVLSQFPSILPLKPPLLHTLTLRFKSAVYASWLTVIIR